MKNKKSIHLTKLTSLYNLFIIAICTILFACNNGAVTSNNDNFKLTISPLVKSSIIIGESTTATIKLNSNSSILTPILVPITNNAEHIINVSPTNCELTTKNSICVVTLTGLSVGNATFSVGTGKQSQTSESLEVISKNTIIAANMTTPKVNATSVGIGTPVIINFIVPIESSTITKSTFTLESTDSTIVEGNINIAESTLTFIPTNPLSYNTNYTVHLNSGITDKSGTPISPYSAAFTTQKNNYMIYFAHQGIDGYDGSMTKNANDEYGTNFTNGITAADYLCNHDEMKPTEPSGAIYKAILVDGNNRWACKSPNCINYLSTEINTHWVLHAYSAYRNESVESASMITNEYGIYDFTKTPETFNTLTTPLTNELSKLWTGLNQDWTSQTDNCNSWTFAGVGVYGSAGQQSSRSDPSILSSEQINDNQFTPACFHSLEGGIYGIMCAQQ